MRPTVLFLTLLTSLLPGFAEKQKIEKLDGYAEWFKGGALIVEGQRVVASAATRFEGKGISGLNSIPLGYEVKVRGERRPDGTVLALSLEARPNGTAMFESEITQATDTTEAKWLASGSLSEEDGKGHEKTIGRLVPSGPPVDRVSRIAARVAPPYIGPSRIRVHVVDTREWNAMAMGNGALWVFTGLLEDMSDDEVAVVVGHELAHYTHEHTRRSFKRAMWAQLIAAGIAIAADRLDDKRLGDVLALAGMFSMLAWQNGYGRDLEDQADRVGLRYAYEAGFDVACGPRLWKRFRDKYGGQNRVLNFFLGDHSQSSARIRNLEREIALNYTLANP